jgi:cellulose synthase operon protein C
LIARPRPTTASATRLRALFALLSILALVACGAAAPAGRGDPLAALRNAAEGSDDPDVVGRWVLGELLVPGGDAARAARARKHLETLPGKGASMYGALARAIDDEAHGRFRDAARAHLEVIAAARVDSRPEAALVAWFSSNHLLRLRTGVQGLWETAREVVTRSIDQPGNIGWRARGELVEWWSVDGLRSAPDVPVAQRGEQPGDAQRESVADASARRYGCVEKARIAGPFGHGAPSDHRGKYQAERPGPWPPAFDRDPRRLQAPRVLPVDRRGCQLRAAEGVESGVFYVETFIDLPAERELIVAVQGAFAILVDDHEVLTRDTAQWGIWPRFGARLRLDAGRHRILARTGGPETSIRLMAPNGTPLAVKTSDDPAPPYALARPTLLPDPNPLDAFMGALGVPPQRGVPRPRLTGMEDDEGRPPHEDPILRYLAAYVAHIEGQEDVSGVLIEPLVKDSERATGPALAAQAVYLEKDPIFPPNDARDLVKDVRSRAARKDPKLWWPRIWLVLDTADKAGLAEAAPEVQKLADEFREVPDIIKGLAAMYGRLGWKAEQSRAVVEAAARFPDDDDALAALLRLYDEQGKVAEADAVAARLRKLDPDSEVDFERAVQRRDWQGAIAELERLGKRRKDRKDIAARVADLLTRAGRSQKEREVLEMALKRDPSNAGARLALADARFAGGESGALRKALIEAIQTGAETAQLREAIELLEGQSELSAYRVDGKRVIAEFEASGETLPGQASRVLDYSAIWIHEDGSARMLEHEIICLQSREAIQEHAEQQIPRGLVLRVRTIKKDGRVFEPEVIEQKDTVTMPHLEVGDYIETESIMSLRGDGAGGRVFQGPRWFFREEKMAYWRSEFITVSPKNRPLTVETGGTVPAPQVTERGALVTRRWRVDKSPALPEEPGSAPIQEFLPNVRIGWGITLDTLIGRMIDAAADETPRDPRLLRVARVIAAGTAVKGVAAQKHSVDERARRVYRWVLSNVEPGRESDARRVIIGKSGNRAEAFLHLCRLLDIDAEIGMVRDRLTEPSRGPLAEAESFNALAIRVAAEAGPRWMVLRDKFAPYGYLPSSLRGQPAIRLVRGAPRETTGSAGSRDGVTYRGTVALANDGSATLDLEQQFEGRFAIGLRTALETLPEARLKDTIESRLLPQALPGARLAALEVKNLADLDAPLVLAMKIEHTTFARPRGGELALSPPFQMNLLSLAALPARETPLYLSEQLSNRTVVDLRIKLPAGARVTTELGPWSADDDGRKVMVNDRIDKGMLVLDRVVDIPAGRVQPDRYPAFQGFARRADAALRRDVVVVPGGGG